MSEDLNRSGDGRADRRSDYAASYAEAGDLTAAADLMRQALELRPLWIAGWTLLGGYRERGGDTASAIDAYRRALSLDPADGQGAALKLASLGVAAVPTSAPPAFVKGLFDQYADRFETSLVAELGYAGPDLLMTDILRLTGPSRRFVHALDLGCGTGLMGERLRPFADRLTGVDLSPAMIEKARRKAIYDRLDVGDILDAEAGDLAPDLVTAADVLIYVGDLGPVASRVAALVAPSGLFAFTVERHDGDAPFVVGPSLRYRHSRAGAIAPAEAAGFALKSEAPLVLRQDRGEPVEGLAFVFERTGPG
ncbi:MAG: methyltransferase domain-containing protein [Rhizobiaceae bacterium]|nr:methyltransferase domain-containing protein [Rhizobiaceae bacterium]